MSKVKDLNNLAKQEVYSHVYLFGKPGSYFRDLTYKKAIEEKIRLGTELKKELVDVVFDLKQSWEIRKHYEQRLDKVIEAIEYNKLLLKDL